MDLNTIIASVVLSTLISSLAAIHIASRSDKKEREIFLRNKYEEFGELASLFLNEHERFINSKWNDAYKSTSSKTSNKMITMATIYFKEFESITFDFIQAATDHKNKLLELTSKDSDQTIGIQIQGSKAITTTSQQYENTKYDWRELYKNLSGKYTNIK